MHNNSKHRLKGPHEAVSALEAALRDNGHDDLADDVALGPIARAAQINADTESDEDDADVLDEEMEDILDEDGDDEEDDSDDDNSDDEDEDDESFDEVLTEDEDDEDNNGGTAIGGNPISPVILDMNRVYSKHELHSLRSIAQLCISRQHLVPNARALLRSIKEYEANARR